MKLLHLGLALASAASLFFECILTRLFAIAQGYHFAFLVVSLALIGFGASGTALALLQARGRSLPPSTLPLLSLLLAISLPAGYLAANNLPFDPYRLAWEAGQFFLLAGYLVCLAIPFLLAGAIQGLALTLWGRQAGTLYAAGLVGSGLGCVSALAALNLMRAENCVLVGAVVAACATFAFASEPSTLKRDAPHRRTDHRTDLRTGRRTLRRSAVPASAMLILVAGVLLWHTPGWFELRLSPYKPLSQLANYPDARLVTERSNAFSRVDVVETSNLRSAPGLSLGFTGAFPQQTGLVIDADNIYALTARPQISPSLLEALPVALPFQMRPGARTLILEPGGGLDVWVALHYQAESVTAVESNPLIVSLVRRQAGNPYDQPRVQVTNTQARGFLAGSRETFDVIDLALTDNFRPVTAGAFTLSEDYLHTIETFRACLNRLATGGLFVIQRWLQLPPSEELRAAALAVEALRSSGVQDPSHHLVALRSFNTMLLLVKKEPFTPGELEALRGFAEARQFDLVYHPGLRPEETNRFNRLSRDVYYETFRALLQEPTGLYAASEYDIRPPSDEHPFFFHFFKWRQLPTVVALLGKTWQPFGGGGYLLLLGLLGVICLVSLVLTLLPVLALPRAWRRESGPPRWQVLGYFALLGLGFLLVEVPLIQRFILLLDRPVYAFTVVLFGLLVFSGLGSLCAQRVPLRPALLSLVLLVVAYAFFLPPVVRWALPYGLGWRVALSLLVLAPPGFLLGVPFPRGIFALSIRAPRFIPLAWGVNGFTSTFSSVVAMLLALSSSFAWVLHAGALTYAAACVLASFAAIRPRGGAVNPR